MHSNNTIQPVEQQTFKSHLAFGEGFVHINIINVQVVQEFMELNVNNAYCGNVVSENFEKLNVQSPPKPSDYQNKIECHPTESA